MANHNFEVVNVHIDNQDIKMHIRLKYSAITTIDMVIIVTNAREIQFLKSMQIILIVKRQRLLKIY